MYSGADEMYQSKGFVVVAKMVFQGERWVYRPAIVAGFEGGTDCTALLPCQVNPPIQAKWVGIWAVPGVSGWRGFTKCRKGFGGDDSLRPLEEGRATRYDAAALQSCSGVLPFKPQSLASTASHNSATRSSYYR